MKKTRFYFYNCTNIITKVKLQGNFFSVKNTHYYKLICKKSN